jgi:hypothetical protein
MSSMLRRPIATAADATSKSTAPIENHTIAKIPISIAKNNTQISPESHRV